MGGNAWCFNLMHNAPRRSIAMQNEERINGLETQVRTPTAEDIVGVRAASDAFYSALNEMFVGNITSMDNVWSHEDDVTQLGPMGGRLVGWESVGAEWRREAALKLGGTVSAEHVEVVAGPCMGFTVTDEVGQNMTADGKPIEVRFRATNIFRKEAGGWKMVHHHTDLSANLINAVGEVK